MRSLRSPRRRRGVPTSRGSPTTRKRSATPTPSFGSRPKRQHLVPQSAVQTAKDQKYGAGHTSALCRRTKAFWWSDEWYAKDGLIECDACVKAAKKREAVPA